VAGLYGIAPSPVDGSIWGSVLDFRARLRSGVLQGRFRPAFGEAVSLEDVRAAGGDVRPM
jgi:hypothetical protein